MKKVFTLLLMAVTLLCPQLQAQQLSPSFRSAFLQAAVKQNKQTLQKENARYASSQTVRVAQTEMLSTWDDTQWEDMTKTSYTYTNSGQLETVTIIELPDNSNLSKYEYVYSAQGLITDVIFYVWDNGWVKAMKISLGADNDPVNNISIYKWSLGNWVLERGVRTNHTTVNGRITESITEFYSIMPPATQGWEQTDKIVYSYTGSDSRPASSITYEKQGTVWVATEKRTDIQYVSSTNEISSYFLEVYDAQTTTWSKYKYEYTYSQDAANQTRTTVEKISTVEGSTITPDTRETITEITSTEPYLTETIVGQLQEAYDLATSSWDQGPELKATVTRDANGYITEMVYQEKDLSTGTFVNKDRYVYTDFLTITVASASDDALALATEMYPNPVQDKLRIVLDANQVSDASLSIYSLTGQKVFEQQNLRGTTTIDMAKLPRGIYMVRLTDASNASVARRIVKQ